MDTSRRTAVVAGVLFIIATVANLAGAAMLRPILGTPVDLARISADETRVLLGALFLFVAAVACPAIAIALYPVLRKHGEGLALGSVGFRLIEGTLYIGSVVGVLMLVALGQEATTAGTSGTTASDLPATLLVAGREGLGQMAILTFGLGALLYYWVFFGSRLIPRWLSVWGLVAAVSVMLSALLVMFHVVDSLSTTQVVLALPIGVQEMVLAVWLIAKGFDRSAIASESSGGRSTLRPAASAGSAT